MQTSGAVARSSPPSERVLEEKSPCNQPQVQAQVQENIQCASHKRCPASKPPAEKLIPPQDANCRHDDDFLQRMQEKENEHKRRLRALEEEMQREQQQLLNEMAREQQEHSARRKEP